MASTDCDPSAEARSQEVSKRIDNNERGRAEMAGIRLLRDTDERRLAMDLENLRHLEMLETTHEIEPAVDHPRIGERGSPRSPWQVVLLLLLRIARAGPVAQSIGRCLEVERRMSLRYVKRSGILDEAGAIEIDDYLIDWVAGECWISLDDARDQIVQLSCDFWLLPTGIVDVVHAYVPFADRLPLASLAWFLADPRLVDRIMLAGLAAAAHFDRIRRRGRSAEARLVAMNRFLVESVAREYVGRRFDRQRLVRVGTDELLRAAAEFDPRDGYEFGDNAARRIREAMARAVAVDDAAAPADALANAAGDIVAVLRRRRSLLRELRREPTVEELSQATGLSVERIAEVRDLRTGQDGPAGDMQRLAELVTSGTAPDTIC